MDALPHAGNHSQSLEANPFGTLACDQEMSILSPHRRERRDGIVDALSRTEFSDDHEERRVGRNPETFEFDTAH